MKPTLFFPALLLLSPFSAAETPVNELLRDGFYAEEVSRDAEAAAKHYSAVLDRYAGQRQFAATAIFRLAEVRRKQGRKDDAIALYQRLITEFPDLKDQVGPAKESLTALGGKLPVGDTPGTPPASDDDSKELARIQALEKTSPDRVNLTDFLVEAASKDYFRTVSYLLEKGANPNSLGSGNYAGSTPLASAAGLGNLAMAEKLLAAGANINGMGDSNPLRRAVISKRPLVVDFLLRHKADPNVLSSSSGDSILAQAVRQQNLELIGKLLDAGADVNLTQPESGWTPLHFAVLPPQFGKIIRRLLEAGAKPGIPAKRNWRSENRSVNFGEIRPGETALELAVTRDAPEIGAMLARQPDADLSGLLARAIEDGSVEVAALLLKKGADAKAPGRNGVPLLIRAVQRQKPELVELLLKAGADPNATFEGRDHPEGANRENYPIHFNTPLRAVISLPASEAAWELAMFEQLADGGAKPDPEWLKSVLTSPNGARPQFRSLRIVDAFIDRFVIPETVCRQEVSLVMSPNQPTPSVLQAKAIAAPLDLARLLLEPESPIQWAQIESANFKEILPTIISVWRKDNQGKAAVAWKGTMDQQEKFPPLQWGDVVRLSPAKPLPSAVSFSYGDELPPALQWELRRKISFPVKIEVAGKWIGYEMRGDRLAFDATKRELPLVRVDRLSTIFAEPDETIDRAIVSREGWPDVRLDQRTMQFPLNPGDSIRFMGTPRGLSGDPLQTRRARVLLHAPGLPANRSYSVIYNEKPLPPPTLTEALADILSMNSASPRGAKPEEMVWRSQQRFQIETLWNQPDFSKITIRRLKPDGSEETMPVDFAAIIAAADGSGTSDEVRKQDILLQGGDIVAIPLKGDPDGTWSGLTAEEQEFFAKVLNCRVQLMDINGGLELKELRYKAHEFIPTEAGKLPVNDPADQNAVQTLRAFDALSDRTVIKLDRGAKTYGDGTGRGLFLHDGDQVTTQRANPPQVFPGAQSPVRMPRPQVIPPPPSNAPQPRVVPTPVPQR